MDVRHVRFISVLDLKIQRDACEEIVTCEEFLPESVLPSSVCKKSQTVTKAMNHFREI